MESGTARDSRVNRYRKGELVERIGSLIVDLEADAQRVPGPVEHGLGYETEGDRGRVDLGGGRPSEKRRRRERHNQDDDRCEAAGESEGGT
jgi:hypothetical protein